MALALAGGGLIASGCATHRPPLPVAVSSWASAASFGQSSRFLETDVAEIGRGIAAGRLGATHTACDGLATDAGNALGALPTPDQRLTDQLNTAYLDLARAAEDCSLADRPTMAAFARYRAAAGRGLAALQGAVARERSLVGGRPRRAGAAG